MHLSLAPAYQRAVDPVHWPKGYGAEPSVQIVTLIACESLLPSGSMTVMVPGYAARFGQLTVAGFVFTSPVQPVNVPEKVRAFAAVSVSSTSIVMV